MLSIWPRTVIVSGAGSSFCSSATIVKDVGLDPAEIAVLRTSQDVQRLLRVDMADHGRLGLASQGGDAGEQVQHPRLVRRSGRMRSANPSSHRWLRSSDASVTNRGVVLRASNESLRYSGVCTHTW